MLVSPRRKSTLQSEEYFGKIGNHLLFGGVVAQIGRTFAIVIREVRYTGLATCLVAHLPCRLYGFKTNY